MKRIVIVMLLSLPLALNAQDVWENPNAPRIENTKQKVKKDKKVKTKDISPASQTQSQKTKKMKIDKKYAVGAVPEVNGKVEWNHHFVTPGHSAEQNFNKVQDIFNEICRGPEQTNRSQICAINRRDHIVAAQFVEELTFSKSIIAHDFTEFHYTLIATCHDGFIDITLCRMSYHYEKQRESARRYTAEEWITDNSALNKARTNVYPGNGKFRIKTIDRKDELFHIIESKLHN